TAHMGFPIRHMMKAILASAIALNVSAFPGASSYATQSLNSTLEFRLTIANGLLESPTDGRVVLVFAPNEIDPLNDTNVRTSPNKIYRKNVYEVDSRITITFSGGSNSSTSTRVYGWPNISMMDIAAGTYQVQAFLIECETVTRTGSDGAKVSVNFPCGDGAPNINSFGSLTTPSTKIHVSGNRQTIDFVFNNVMQVTPFTGNEIGGCYQGNYPDNSNMRYIKIRSQKLSAFWGCDMYRYGRNATFTTAWDQGIYTLTGTNKTRPAPKMILVTFRHEAPFYDDSYAVNTVNLGPHGDAINDELIPHIDASFNTIQAPYARIQEGGSTGGWASIANVVYRPDLFGACFSSYPDSLDFHKHQNIELYTSSSAYYHTRHCRERESLGTCFGTASRSSNQWDVWNAVTGVQGYNNYPLEPWDKFTGEIYPETVEFWKLYVMSDYIVSNFNITRNLGKNLAGRLLVYVGTWDAYFLNEGVTAPSTRDNLWEEVIKRSGCSAAVSRQAPPSISLGSVKDGAQVTASVGPWDPGVILKAQ
ncbi:hypothetical protein IAQ61_001446, partial [Plenodomus lingam]|uniref:uncharacterized protein n=1 Tax=Leptosphaeria maculans TaxID=5022 RepID=UPI003319FCD5